MVTTSHGVWCKSPSEIPTEPHFAILESRSFQDGVSGLYDTPAWTAAWDYIVFPSQEAWEAEIIRRAGLAHGSKNFVAISAHRAQITTHVSVTVKS